MTDGDPAGDAILIVLRGPSAVGKSTLATGLRNACGQRKLAIVRQDVIRRELLCERDEPGAHTIDLLEQVTRFSLSRGFHTVLEGILYSGRYGAMLARLAAAHPGPQHWFYLHAPFGTTLERHATKPEAAEYGEHEMRGWYRELDLLPGGRETVIGPESTAEQTLARIIAATGLLDH